MSTNKHDNKIRNMQQKDLDWVVQLGLSTPEFKTGTESAQFYSFDSLQRWIKDPNGVTLVAETEDQKTGFLLGYYLTGPNDGYINCIVVGQKFRGRGVGELLQESALDAFESKGSKDHKCDHVFCVVGEGDNPMLGLMRKAGFEIGRKFHYVDIMLPREK